MMNVNPGKSRRAFNFQSYYRTSHRDSLLSAWRYLIGVSGSEPPIYTPIHKARRGRNDATSETIEGQDTESPHGSLD